MVVVAACGAPRRPAAAPPVVVEEAPPDAAPDAADVPALPPLPHPPLRFADVTTELVWPLVVPPSLLPHASPAGSWDTACEQRGRLTAEALEYVVGWCRARADAAFDLPAVLVQLAPRDAQLAEAIRLDLANVVPAMGDHGGVLAWLDDHRAGAHLRDLTVAVLASQQRYDEAREIALGIQGDGVDTAETRCRRGMVIASILPLEQAGAAFRAFAESAQAPACFADAHELVADTHPDLPGARTPLGRLVIAYARWPSAGGGDAWLQEAERAEAAMPSPHAEELALLALRNALRAACDRTTVFGVNVAASRLRTSPHHEAAYDDQIDRLAQVTAASCAAGAR